jgi:hypothetical protein
MISPTETQWAETPKDELKKIAAIWAQRPLKHLRGRQAWYLKKQVEAYESAKPDAEKLYQCYENMWQVATWAIVIREFKVKL